MLPVVPWGRIFVALKLRYIAGFGLVEMAISTNPKSAIYCNLYENTGLVAHQSKHPDFEFILTFFPIGKVSIHPYFFDR